MSNVTVTYDVYDAISYEDAIRIMAAEVKAASDAVKDADSLEASHGATNQVTNRASSNTQKMAPERRISREFNEKLAETILLYPTIISFPEAEALEEGANYGYDDE